MGLGTVRDYGIVISFVLLFIVLSVASDFFLTTKNLLNLLDQSSDVGIIACAGTLVVIAGGLDLSVGATFALAGVVAAEMVPKIGVPGSFLLALVCSAAVGVVNGFLVTGAKINSIIATFASGILISGASLLITNGYIVTVTDPGFTNLGLGSVFGVKYSVVVWAVFAGLLGFMLWRTRIGRYIYAVGANAEAARLSGIRVGTIRVMTFAISGLGAGISGIIIASRVATGQSDVGGTALTLSAIAAIVVGGTSILGGQGAIWRTVLGVLLLSMISNGMNLLNVNPTFQEIVQGAIILIAVAVDASARRRSR
jgi:ribose transport system permease protein